MLRSSSAVILVLTVAQAGWTGQQPRDNARQDLPRGAVTVFHRVDLTRLIRRLEQEQPHSKIGMMGPVRNPINITTGLVIDQAGHIITRLVNLDPEDKDQDLTVRGADGAQFRAKLVGVDCPTGFAVLEVDSGSGLAPAAASGPVDEGAQVTLFSSDLGRSTTVTADVIRFSTEVIALDGKIAPGTLFSRARGALTLESIGLTSKNDSGIVETLDNKIVGMAQSAGLSSGMAYVFPYEFLRGQVLARVLDRNGTVPAGWLGVVPESAGAGSPRGVVVKEVQHQSTAEVCGLQAKDIIVGLDQFEITGQADMAAVLSALPAGRKIRLRAMRDQKPMEVEAVLGAKQIGPIMAQPAWGPPMMAPTSTATPMSEERLSAGFIARELTAQLAGYFGVKSGTLVTEVSKGSPADKAGLLAGDVVVGADDQDVQSVLELKALFSAGAGAIKLKIYRNRSVVLVNIPDSNSPNTK